MSSWRMAERNQGDKEERGTSEGGTRGGRRNGWMGSIGFYLHVLINASPPSSQPRGGGAGGSGEESPDRHPRSCRPQLRPLLDPTTGLACACACPYKCTSSPAFRTITVSTRAFIRSSERDAGMNIMPGTRGTWCILSARYVTRRIDCARHA